jgi:16S rRNA (adenine1518-N6/adenine1519-N6)-dimethyltransferase
LARHGLRADKSHGQHFLASGAVVGKILAAASGCAGVLEVGPGPGVLTGPLSAMARVKAIEVDSRMAPLLAEAAPEAEIVWQDALKSDWRGALKELPEPRAVVSNMPYNVTGPLLDRVECVADLIDRAVLMMQREVGEKILAQPGDRRRGALSVVFEAAFTVSRVSLVPPGAFLPPPKVESVVLLFRPTGAQLTDHEREVVRTGFRQPRKTLANNLGVRDMGGLPPTVRPHELTLEQWRQTAALV